MKTPLRRHRQRITANQVPDLPREARNNDPRLAPRISKVACHCPSPGTHQVPHASRSFAESVLPGGTGYGPDQFTKFESRCRRTADNADRGLVRNPARGRWLTVAAMGPSSGGTRAASARPSRVAPKGPPGIGDDGTRGGGSPLGSHCGTTGRRHVLFPARPRTPRWYPMRLDVPPADAVGHAVQPRGERLDELQPLLTTDMSSGSSSLRNERSRSPRAIGAGDWRAAPSARRY